MIGIQFGVLCDDRRSAWVGGLVEALEHAGARCVWIEREVIRARWETGEADFVLDVTEHGASLPPVLPRWGVWRLFVGGEPAASLRAGRAEVVGGAAATRVAWTGRGGTLGADERVVAQGWIRTHPYSAPRLAATAREIAADLAARAARGLKVGNLPAGLAPPSKAEPQPSRVAELRAGLAGFVDTQRGALLSDHWCIGVVDHPIQRFLETDFRPRVDWMPTPTRDVFAADPFGWEDESGALQVMFERFDFRLGRGVVAHVARLGPGAWSAPRVVLGGDTHLSYPYLVRHGDELLAFPENAETDGVRAYRIQGATLRPAAPALPFPGLDPTVFEHDGRWWLLATDSRKEPVSSMFVWHAPSPLGPWTPHGRNPVKTDVRSTRSGGTPFVHDGVLYRPAQDCSLGYGAALSICRVESLTPTDFRETVVARVLPFAGFHDGLHTLSAAGRTRTLIDGKRRVLVPVTIPHRLRARAARLRDAAAPASRGVIGT